MSEVTQVINKNDRKEDINLDKILNNLMYMQSGFENKISQNTRKLKGVFFYK